MVRKEIAKVYDKEIELRGRLKRIKESMDKINNMMAEGPAGSKLAEVVSLADYREKPVVGGRSYKERKRAEDAARALNNKNLVKSLRKTKKKKG